MCRERNWWGAACCFVGSSCSILHFLGHFVRIYYTRHGHLLSPFFLLSDSQSALSLFQVQIRIIFASVLLMANCWSVMHSFVCQNVGTNKDNAVRRLYTNTDWNGWFGQVVKCVEETNDLLPLLFNLILQKEREEINVNDFILRMGKKCSARVWGQGKIVNKKKQWINKENTSSEAKEEKWV